MANVGKFDTLVTLLRPEQHIGQAGDNSYVYRRHSDVFAGISRDFAETVVDTNYDAADYVTLTMWKVASLTLRWRVVIRGITYEITAMDPGERTSPHCVLTLHALND